jgi:hypothetical protein
MLVGGIAAAAPSLTVVQDTLYKADGTRFDGTLQIEWKSFRTGNGAEIPQNTLQVSVSGGYLNVALAPTTTGPTAAYYTVRYNTNGRTTFTEYWSVPVSDGPLLLRDVRTHAIGGTPPGNLTAIAIQDVSALRTELDLRPIRGASWVQGRVAVIGTSGGIDAAIGSPGDCVRVDGTAGPCGVGGEPGSGGGNIVFVDAETPAGIIDGINTVFQTSVAANPTGSMLLYLNGMLQRPGTEYTLTGRTITFAPGNAPRQGDSVTAWYRVSEESAQTFADLETPAGAVNGTNAMFTLSGIPMPAASLMLYRNGLLQKAGVDFTISVDQITFLPGAIPQAGDLLQATYRK